METFRSLADFAFLPITLQQIIVFLTVAETNGFAKASSHLHLTQSAVSKSIAKLEKELHILLFTRTTREIHLTEAGRFLYEAWKVQIQAMDHTYRKALTLQNQKNTMLHIGILNTARPEKYFFRLEGNFRRMHPDISLELESEYMTLLEEKLMEHVLDAIMIPDFERYTIEENGLSWKWAARSNACAIIPSSNPLSQKPSFTTKDLLHQDFVSLSNVHSPNYLRDLSERFAPYRTPLRIQKQFKNAYDIQYLFRSDKAILLADQYFDFEGIADFVKIPITDQWNGIICAWDPEHVSSALQNFLQILPDESNTP